MSGIFSNPKSQPLQPTTPPSVSADAATSDPEKLARTGRASLIATTPQGVLGNAQTGRKKLSV